MELEFNRLYNKLNYILNVKSVTYNTSYIRNIHKDLLNILYHYLPIKVHINYNESMLFVYLYIYNDGTIRLLISNINVEHSIILTIDDIKDINIFDDSNINNIYTRYIHKIINKYNQLLIHNNMNIINIEQIDFNYILYIPDRRLLT